MHKLIGHNRIIGVLLALAVGLSTIWVIPASAGDLVVIVNKEVPADAISASDLGRIFLGKTRLWESGEKIVLAVWSDPDASDTFLKRYTRKKSDQYYAYWTRRVFTGKGTMPVYFDSQEEITEFVKSTKGAISFLSAPVDPSVKTLIVK